MSDEITDQEHAARSARVQQLLARIEARKPSPERIKGAMKRAAEGGPRG
jgi:hypothetical protein